MIRHIGSFSVGALFPTMIGLLAGVLTNLSGQLQGCYKVSGQIQVSLPSVQARVDALTRIAAQVALQPPAVTFNAAANLQLITTLQAQIALIGELQAALGLGTAGVEVYEYEGTAGAFGRDVTGETAAGLNGGQASDQMQALVLATRYSAVFEALRTIIPV